MLSTLILNAVNVGAGVTGRGEPERADFCHADTISERARQLKAARRSHLVALEWRKGRLPARAWKFDLCANSCVWFRAASACWMREQVNIGGCSR